jgi:glycosyltransferase involved in cell wall biosynthesis
VIGQAGLLFNPICPSDLANKIERLLSDEYLRSELVSRGLTRVQQFSWKRSAGELWEILQSCQ